MKNEISAGTSPAGYPRKEGLELMATIGTGRDDPRRWVKAAYHLTDAMERGETGPQGQLPTRSEVAARRGIGEGTVARAYRELIGMSIIYRVDGYGYFPTSAARPRCADAGTGRPGQQA
jgi:DNA-binding GntR family transcriptional regulator